MLQSITRKEGKNLLFTFTDCLVKHMGEVLFQPQWGTYDMALGAGIISCYSGVADPAAYHFEFAVPTEKTHKLVHSEEAKKLHSFYDSVREMREDIIEPHILNNIFHDLKLLYPDDWLLALEMHELLEPLPEYENLKEEILRFLKLKAIEHGSLLKLIQDGLALGKSHSQVVNS